MKLTKKMLRKMILEEQKLMTEYNPAQDPAKRAVGLYFDVRMMEELDRIMYDIFENAMGAAQADGLEPDEAYEMVMGGFEQIIEEIQTDMRY